MSTRHVSASEIKRFRRTIWGYYKKHGRHLPWRQVITPYRVLVSEIMLQQTQVSRVLKKYPEFLKAFPSFAALARAKPAQILKVWQGMGYNRRALALYRIAGMVTREWSGRVPREAEPLAQLPGIGQATAASIVAFTFNSPEVFIETNIRRAFIHFFFPGRIDVSDGEIRTLVALTLEKKRPREWYWALMDYGSALAKKIENPNRRSRHYRRQTRFEGSRRQMRGRILKMLLDGGPFSAAQLAKKTNLDHPVLTDILKQLEREGFIQQGRLIRVR